MKVKAILTAVLLTVTNFVWASGGLSIDNVKTTNFESNDNHRPEIVVKGPIDKFNVQTRDVVVNKNKLRQDYDGQS